MTDTADERPMTHPERLRAIADWLDMIDPVVAEVFKRTQPDHPQLAGALETVEGGEMQADLRKLADDMERSTVPFDSPRTVNFYMVPEWKPGGREAHMEFLASLKPGREVPK